MRRHLCLFSCAGSLIAAFSVFYHFAHGLGLILGNLDSVLVFCKDGGRHNSVGRVEEAYLVEPAEELLPVDIAVTNLEVLVHAHGKQNIDLPRPAATQV